MPSTSKEMSLIECEQPQAVPQQQPQHLQSLMNENDASKLLSSDDRLSPNLFLNFDNSGGLDSNVNSLKFEWSNFNPNMINSVPSLNISMSPVPINSHKQMSSSSSYISSPTYEFLNVDQFNMDNFKNECILNLDHNLLNSVHDSTTSLSPMPSRSIDLNSFSLVDDTKELLDLEKPININISDKF